MTDHPHGAADKNDPAIPDTDVEKLKAADAKQLHRAVREEGEDELDRPAISLFWSGLAAGFAASASLIAEGSIWRGLPDTPWRESIAALGYPVGFLIVVIGRMQLFTESTITAILPFATKPSWWSAKRTLRLWAIVLLSNLIGTAITSLAIAGGYLGLGDIRGSMIEVARLVNEHDAWMTFVNAIPAGFLVAVIAWSLPNARQQSFLIIFAFTYVISAANFTHSIIGSSETFLLLFAGEIGLARAFGGILIPAILGNLVGGAGLFALLAHGQVSGELHELKEQGRFDEVVG